MYTRLAWFNSAGSLHCLWFGLDDGNHIPQTMVLLNVSLTHVDVIPYGVTYGTLPELSLRLRCEREREVLLDDLALAGHEQLLCQS